MPNLAKYLLASNSLSHRKAKPRFWWLVVVVVVVIFVILFWDKLAPETWVTSPYMKAVFYEGGKL